MNLEDLTNISAWVFCICGLISTMSLIVTAVFESNITAWITVITFIICVLDIVVDIGLILCGMLNWYME